MFEPNVEVILARLSAGAVVLDVGGWAAPFNRANIVMDNEPFETRGYCKTQHRQGAAYARAKPRPRQGIITRHDD